MAKGNMLLGTLRGSIGDVTYTRTKGAQISKAKSTSPRNPRTSKQIYQRMFFATIAKAKSAMKNIVDHSFEQVQHGSKSLQYFSKRNIALMRQTAVFSDSLQTWVAPGMGFVPPKAISFTWNPYRISEGSLAKLNVPSFPETIPESAPGERWQYAPFFDHVPENPGNTPVFQLYSNIIQNNGCKVGDYMTLCFISAKNDDIAQGAGVFYNCRFHFVRFKVCKYISSPNELLVLVPTNVDGVNFNIPDVFTSDPGSEIPMLDDDSILVSTGYMVEDNPKKMSAINLSSMLLQNLYYVGVDQTVVGFTFDNPISSDDAILAATWIHSRPKANNKILVSTQDMILADESGDVYEFNLGLIDAYDEWNELVKQVGNDNYILQGGNAATGA